MGMIGVIVSNLIVLKMNSNQSEANQQQQVNQKHQTYACNDVKCDFNIDVLSFGIFCSRTSQPREMRMDKPISITHTAID